jgi:PBP1b-binding outer membrane lipoprotein LpoB
MVIMFKQIKETIVNKFLMVIICCCIGSFIMSGCLTPPSSGYVPAEESGVMTVQLDDHDYDLAAESVAKEMMERGLPKGFVVALGPVDTRDCKYNVQIATLQKKLQVIFNKQGDLKFMAAVDAMSGGSTSQEIYKLIEFNWFKNNPVDKEDLQKFGKLANVNGILFGRVSCLERSLPQPRSGKEVTYTFVWELANTSTGISEIAHEKKIRKNIR